MANKDTQFKKGKPKTGGRKPGVKNRSTEQIRSFIQDIVNNNLDNLEHDLATMSAFNRWLTLEKLTKYFLPALTKNDNNNVNSGAIKIILEYKDQLENKEGKDEPGSTNG